MAAENEEEDDINGPTPLDKLQQYGISTADIKKFVDGGYHTVEALCYVPRKTLINVKGISEAKLDKVLEAAKQEVKMDFMTAGAYLDSRKHIV